MFEHYFNCVKNKNIILRIKIEMKYLSRKTTKVCQKERKTTKSEVQYLIGFGSAIVGLPNPAQCYNGWLFY
jgi:hypothetical protein